MLADRKAENPTGLVHLPDYKVVDIWSIQGAGGINAEQLKLNFVDDNRNYSKDITKAIEAISLELQDDSNRRDGTLLAYRGANLLMEFLLSTFA